MSSLKVMLVDASAERAAALADVLARVDCEIVACLADDADLTEQVRRLRPDVVIIDIDSPTRDTLENLRSVQTHSPRPLVMFSQDDDGQSIRRAIEAGVSAYVVDGIQTHRVRPILDAAIARFERFSALEAELDRTRSRLSERKTIERAKGMIMSQRGISEAEAYRLMRKSAMDQNRRLVDVAESILSAAQLLGAG